MLWLSSGEEGCVGVRSPSGLPNWNLTGVLGTGAQPPSPLQEENTAMTIQTYTVTLDHRVAGKTARAIQMTIEEFKAYNARKREEAMAKFNADVAASGLRNLYV